MTHPEFAQHPDFDAEENHDNCVSDDIPVTCEICGVTTSLENIFAVGCANCLPFEELVDPVAELYNRG